MTQSEFLSFVGLVIDAAGCAARCGELAKCPYGRTARYSMGQIMVSHDGLSLWFSPEEFEDFYRLASTARERLADLLPLPSLGVPWTMPGQNPQTSTNPLSPSVTTSSI
jgi:hypothetical protein